MSPRVALGALVAAAIIGCSSASTAPAASGDGGAFATEAFARATSARGLVVAEVRTAPVQPPTHGVLTVELTLRDAATSAPLDGLTVDVTPWMTAMGHASSVKPTVTSSGQGRYMATHVDLFMPGRWELRVTLSGAVEDTLAPVLDVP